MRLPPLWASNTPAVATVPQFPVAVGKVITALLLAIFPDTVNVTVFLVYPLPDISVPDDESVGAFPLKKRPIYHALGLVAELVVSSQVKTRFSNVSVRASAILITPYS
tara:strand:- start:1348 stop:1671 length:324 start_codon:yes stop_codon:yes gene_type:complete